MRNARSLAALAALPALLAPLACDSAPEPEPPDAAPAAAGTVDADRVEELRALGYVDVGEPLTADAEVGVLRFDRARARPGLNLYTDAKGCSTHLMDMEGRILHSWSHAPCFRWENTVLLPDGDLLAPARLRRGRDPASADAARTLMRLGWDGTVRWSAPLPVHHDAELAPSGRILALAHRFRALPELHPSIPVRDHRLLLLSPAGELIEELSLWDVIAASPDVLSLQPVRPRSFEGGDEIDVFHSNAVEWMRWPELVGRHPIYGADTVLVCIRNQDALAILDWRAKALLWAWGPGELSGPHDATLLPDGHILVFDNGLGRGWSRVVEIDPLAREIVWEYRAPEPASFYSRTRGASQRLSGGNTLVTESDSGRAFEVTREGDVVWEFLNPDLTAKREPGVIVRMRRLEGLDYADVLERVGAGEPLPRTD